MNYALSFDGDLSVLAFSVLICDLSTIYSVYWERLHHMNALIIEKNKDPHGQASVII
jgi:hypothetical protein